LGNALPDEVRESLAFLAEGLPLDEVLDLYASLRGKTITVDTEDYERALQQPDSKRRFIMNPSMQDLDAMLKEPLAKWRLFLHPQQRTLVEKQFNGSARVLGSAGTGKTVVAMHRAKYLASTIFPNDSDRILLTTFTSYLSANISQLMKSLCPDELSRIDIMHLHSWAARFLLKHGIQFKVISDEEAQEFWSAACNKAGVQDWGIGFVRQEWNLVVQAKGIERKEDYLRFPRIGRGTTLSRSERAEIWQVFDEYQKMLHQYHKREWIDVIRETRHLLESRASTLPYRAIIVDEAQDFHEEEWRLIRAMVPRGPNDIFVVGDAHQRIFGGQIVLGRCGIDIRGRASKLRINYRTTEQIRNWAIAMLDGSPYDDLDGGVDNLTGYTSLRNGVQPTVLHFNTLAEEQTSLLSILHAQLRQRPAEEICLVSASRSILQRDYLPLLENAHIPFLFLGKTDSGNPSGIRVTNMHRVKGLEFASVIAVGVNESMNPNTPHEVADNPSDRKEYEARQRSLLYVSATRARDELIISCHGKPSPYIEQSIVVSCNER
jgi:superfamily I DNA/RNA helicase